MLKTPHGADTVNSLGPVDIICFRSVECVVRSSHHRLYPKNLPPNFPLPFSSPCQFAAPSRASPNPSHILSKGPTMPPEAMSETSPRESPPGRSLSGVPTPATPGIWSVSHRDIDRVQAKRQRQTSGPRSSFELVTDVTFLWSYSAKSAFVTGTFSNWETTVPMTFTQSPEGPLWVLSKALPPGDYQYKCMYFQTSQRISPLILDRF